MQLIRTNVLSLFIITTLLFASKDTQAQDSLTQYNFSQLDSIIEVFIAAETVELLIPYAEAGLKKTTLNDSLRARMYYVLGLAYDFGLDKPDQALSYYNKALSIQPANTEANIHTKLQVAELYNYVYADHVKAAEICLEAQESYRISPYSQTLYADILLSLGIIYRMQGNYTAAEVSVLEAAKVTKKEKGEKHRTYISCLNTLVTIQLDCGAYKKAEITSKKMLLLVKEVLGEESYLYGIGLNNLAFLYQQIGLFSEVETLYKEAIRIEAKINGSETETYADALSNLAVFYHELNRLEEVEPLYLKTHAIYKKILKPEHHSYSISLNNLAGLYSDMNRFEEAEAFYKEALALAKKLYGTFHPAYATPLINLADLYFYQGRTDHEVEHMFFDAMKIDAHFFGKKSINYANTLNNLGSFYRATNRPKKAEESYLEAIKIKKEKLGVDNPTFIIELGNLAGLHLSQKSYSKAEQLYLQCLALNQQYYPIKNNDYIRTLNDLSTVYVLNLDYQKAWDCVDRAIEKNLSEQIGLEVNEVWADKILNKKNIAIISMIASLKTIYALLETGNTVNYKNKQLIVADLALKLLKKIRDSYIRETDKLRILKKNNAWVLRYLKVVDKETQIEHAFETAEQNKSVLLMDLLKTQAAHQFGELPDSLILQEEKISKKHSKLSAKILENRPQPEKDSLLKLMNLLNLETQNFKKTIERNYPKYANFKYKKDSISIKKIQSNLDAKTALVEYVLGEDSMIYIFYIDKSNAELISHPISSKKLDLQIKKFQATLSDYNSLLKNPKISYQKYTTLAHWFYQNLIAPFHANLKEINNLVIITDGKLGHLPFETFLVEKAAQSKTEYRQLHYLITDYNISYDYSALLWTENAAISNNNNGQLLAMASNYDLNLNAPKLDFRLPAYQRLRTELQALPAARKEVSDLSEEFVGLFCFDSLASERMFKKKAKDYAVIHLAMHGILDQENQILSSLAFTENADSLENNFLHAYEISKMNLNADLVVLSACETGYGKFEKGNGIASLARSFMYAGTPALIVSLWQVNDGATSIFMKQLYQNLAKGMTKPAALRQSKLDYLQNTQGLATHPAFWAAFIQIGNTNPITISTKGGNNWFWYCGGLALLFLGVFGGIRKTSAKV